MTFSKRVTEDSPLRWAPSPTPSKFILEVKDVRVEFVPVCFPTTTDEVAKQANVKDATIIQEIWDKNFKTLAR